MREHHAVVLDIALMGPLVHPNFALRNLGTEPPDIIPIHVEVRSALGHPSGQLVSAASAQHHASTVESNSMEESTNSWIFTHNGLVIWSE